MNLLARAFWIAYDIYLILVEKWTRVDLTPVQTLGVQLVVRGEGFEPTFTSKNWCFLHSLSFFLTKLEKKDGCFGCNLSY